MKYKIMSALAACLLGLSANSAFAEKVIIAHFGNPLPMVTAVVAKKFEKATGWEIEWRKFNAGTEINAAMASGDVVIAEQGSSPLAIAASQGMDLKMFMFAFVIGDAESLIVRNGSGIETLADIKGKKVAVPVGSTAHFSLNGAIQHAGLTTSDVEIVNMTPDQIAAAWQQGTIDAAFIWQPVQSEILKSGKLLVSATETAQWGFPTFDAWVVNEEFAEKHAAELQKFVDVMEEANQDYLNNGAKWTAESEEVKAIANFTGASPDQVPDILKGYKFIPMKEQGTSEWLGNAPALLKNTAEFLKSAGRIDTAAGDYSNFVTTEFAR